MSRQDPKKNAAIPPIPGPPEGDAQVARSGAGAQTALLAMLKKRQMRATRDPESQQPDEEDKKLPGG